MASGYDWNLPPLDAGDQRLVEAYKAIGKPVDELPYTEDFDRLTAMMSRPLTDEARHQIYRRLLRLHQRGRLPRLPMFRA